MDNTMEPSKEVIEKFFRYDPETGLMHRRIHRQVSLIGKPVIRPTVAGYMRVIILGREFYVHRLAWVVCRGPIPRDTEIDHIDRNPSNNALNNLRLATRSQNTANCSLDKRNTSGHRGIHKHGASWRIRTHFMGKRIYVGGFKSKKQACDAFDMLAKDHWGDRYYDSVTNHY